MKLIFALATLLFVGLAPAATVMMRFETTLNTTAFGGAEATPLVVTYSFDSDLIAGTGPGELNGTTVSSYGPLSSMEIKLGNEILSGTAGSGVSVWNNSVDGDSYEVRVDFPEGTVFGLGVSGFRFLIVDSSGTMLSDTGLPTVLNVSSGLGFFQQTDLDLDDVLIMDLSISEFATTPVEVRTPFSLTVIPEPGSLGMVGVAALGAAGIRRRGSR